MSLFIATMIGCVLVAIINVNDTTKFFALRMGFWIWERRWTMFKSTVLGLCVYIGWNLPHWTGA
ncbi:MAG: hypothetical protein DRQ40_07470 [Gammaproteobacteria bacterium]|nr:MAG: hypothetical protein DRQ40_07470 [Gammaproteobacteria bacterium]